LRQFTGEIVMNEVFVPDENYMPSAGLAGPFGCLGKARYGSPGRGGRRNSAGMRHGNTPGSSAVWASAGGEPDHPIETGEHDDGNTLGSAGTLQVGR
jgi:hypothetical protein